MMVNDYKWWLMLVSDEWCFSWRFTGNIQHGFHANGIFGWPSMGSYHPPSRSYHLASSTGYCLGLHILWLIWVATSRIMVTQGWSRRNQQLTWLIMVAFSTRHLMLGEKLTKLSVTPCWFDWYWLVNRDSQWVSRQTGKPTSNNRQPGGCGGYP